MISAQTKNENKNWHAEIEIGFAYQRDKTLMATLKQFGPLRVQRPFYPEDDVCHVYLLHPPGGIVGGDTLHTNISVEENSHALMTTPGATKYYRSANDFALVKNKLRLSNNSILEWFPQENILFPGAKVNIHTEIHLQGNANIIAWDISCLGRPANNEIFSSGALNSTLSIYRDQMPIFIEHQRIFDKKHLSATAGLRNFPMSGLFICSGCNESHLLTAREVVSEVHSRLPLGITLLDDLLVLRILGQQTSLIQKTMIDIWQTLRPMIVNKIAMPPRIWST